MNLWSEYINKNFFILAAPPFLEKKIFYFFKLEKNINIIASVCTCPMFCSVGILHACVVVIITHRKKNIHWNAKKKYRIKKTEPEKYNKKNRKSTLTGVFMEYKTENNRKKAKKTNDMFSCWYAFLVHSVKYTSFLMNSHCYCMFCVCMCVYDVNSLSLSFLLNNYWRRWVCFHAYMQLKSILVCFFFF